MTKSYKMLHEKSCLIINMPKIMIIKYQQFAKANTFSISFHILFSPFLHIFPKTHRNQDLGMAKMDKNGVEPPPPPNFPYSLHQNLKFIYLKLDPMKVFQRLLLNYNLFHLIANTINPNLSRGTIFET